MIKGIHHVALSVPDMTEALAFYRDILGLEVVAEHVVDEEDGFSDAVIGLSDIRAKMKMLRAGHSFIELWEYSWPEPRPHERQRSPADFGITHLCFQVDDIGDAHQRLTAGGMRFVGQPVDLGEIAAVYGLDPFGNIVEIFEHRAGDFPHLH